MSGQSQIGYDDKSGLSAPVKIGLWCLHWSVPAILVIHFSFLLILLDMINGW